MKESAFEALFATGCMIIIVAFSTALIALPIMWLNSSTMPGNVAKIEQLRSDAAEVDPAQAEDVIGQVVEWNQRIAAEKVNNTLWWVGWSTPDEWNTIEPIPVPR